eukprot:CAMPEP_0196138342 /NCGR_PEP_ID=MMETSP0910-20130528/6020_1 /TAXON_ID=49265 /ORGANISM="Thalassiosira rotula, Strain GSO102" /LENGTH=312 /DNA_ID=CAMNT_0041398937 /DNA_START=3 /DNA_END=941 /DNA_ORIENTATION=-
MATKNLKSLVICTGASRGIGRAVALAIADAVHASSNGKSPATGTIMFSAPLHMILIARSSECLRETARLVEQRRDASDTISGTPVTTSCHQMDLSDLDLFPDKLEQILTPLSEEKYGSCLLINNAGSLGQLGLASSISGESSMKEMRKAIDFNVTSSIWVSSQFIRTFLPSAEASTAKTPLVRIVNMSSLCAVEPFPTMSIYCAGKSGRDMFHSVLAKEHSSNLMQNDKGADDKEEQKQTFKVLNYAPGLCDTQMTDDLAGCAVLDEGLRKYFSASKEEKKLVRPEETAKKLVQILGLDDYESGSHVDYYDV